MIMSRKIETDLININPRQYIFVKESKIAWNDYEDKSVKIKTRKIMRRQITKKRKYISFDVMLCRTLSVEVSTGKP